VVCGFRCCRTEFAGARARARGCRLMVGVGASCPSSERKWFCAGVSGSGGGLAAVCHLVISVIAN
jgi:hypothetical protein